MRLFLKKYSSRILVLSLSTSNTDSEPINVKGWREKMILFPITWLFCRNRPEDVGQTLDNGHVASRTFSSDGSERSLSLGEALRVPTFWIVSLGAGLVALIVTAVVFSLVPILHYRGLDAGVAADTLTAMAVSMAMAQLATGFLADRLHPSILLSAGALVLGLSAALLLYSVDAFSAVLAGVALGAAQGLFFTTSEPLWARYFGREHLGKIRGLVMTTMVACSSLGPLLAGLAVDVLGSFDAVLTAFLLLPLPLAFLTFWIRKPPRGREGDTGAAVHVR